MSNNFYTTKTAALKATTADIRKLNAQEIKLKDKNILDYIKESEFDSYDTRDPQLKNDELDIWNTGISLSEEGHIEVKPLEHSILCNKETNWEFVYEGVTENQHNRLLGAFKVINNEVFGRNNNHLMYWQTEGLTHSPNDMYYGSSINSFESDLSNLEGALGMFYESSITSFSGDLSNLVSASDMFGYCRNLTSFSSDLPNLVDAYGMFGLCENLTSFSSDLPNLVNGTCMFTRCRLSTPFSSDLSSLADGVAMFEGNGFMTSFNSSLPSLISGSGMFVYCKLDAPSVANIVHTLPIHETGGEIDIGIGCDATEEDQLLFAQECDCETWQELLDDFSTKNWTVTFQFRGRPTTTYNMRRGETLPIYAKLEEVIMPTDEKKRKPHYAYTSADGSKFFNISYFHSTNGSTEGYDVFSSLEEAVAIYNVTPKN